MGVPIHVLAHAGERVLSAQQTNNFERMVNSSGASTANNFNLGGGSFHGGNGDFRSQLQEHRVELAKTIKGLIRSGHLS